MAHEQAEAEHHEALSRVILEFGHIEMYAVMLAQALTPSEPSFGSAVYDALPLARFIRLARTVIADRSEYSADLRDDAEELLKRIAGLITKRNIVVHGVTMTDSQTGDVRRVPAATVGAMDPNMPAQFKAGATAEDLQDLAARAKAAGTDLFHLITALRGGGKIITRFESHPE